MISQRLIASLMGNRNKLLGTMADNGKDTDGIGPYAESRFYANNH